MFKKTLTGAVIAGAVASLLGSGAAFAAGKDKEKTADVKCSGVNDCKGKGACAGDGHGCAGSNECKGKGWTKMTEKDCTAKGGKVVADAKK